MCTSSWNTSLNLIILNGINGSVQSDFSNKLCFEEHAPNFTNSALLRVCVLSAMAILSFIGNFATMWNIKKIRSRRPTRHNWSAIYFFIFHLAIADLLVTGFCIFGEAAWVYTVEWKAGQIACKLVKFFQMFSLYLSTYVLVLIGVDRYVAVKYPMKSLNMAKRCQRFIIVAYILSSLLSIPQILVFDIVKGPFIEEFYQCVTYKFYTAYWQEQLYTSFTLLFMFLIPLGIIITTYVLTFFTISKSDKIFQANCHIDSMQNNRQRLINRAKMKSLRISVVIIAAFIICWTPYYVVMMIFMFLNPDKSLSDDLQSAIFFFGMSNSLVNPLIYGAFHLRRRKSNTHLTSFSNNTKDDNTSQKTLTTNYGTSSEANSRHSFKQQIKKTPAKPTIIKEHIELLSVNK